jgi:glycosyltransferase involved in cell wall biosynthesis
VSPRPAGSRRARTSWPSRWRLAWHRLALAVLARLPAGRSGDGPSGGPRGADDGIVVFVHSAFGMGGTIRSSITQANELARAGRRVTLVSVTRGPDQPEPFFDVHPEVVVRLLDDPGRRRSPLERLVPRVLNRLPSLLFHPDETRAPRMSLWRDVLLVAEIRRYRRGLLIATRAGLNVALAHAARPGVVRIGQEHVPLASYPPRLQVALASSYLRLDALMVLTQGDAEHARELLGAGPPVVEVVPNALPDAPYAVSDSSQPVIATAGRLSRGKRQDLLIRAFARVARHHPGWELRIYGKGGRHGRLQRLVTRLGLDDRVRLMGASDRLGEELGCASVFVLSSELEAFGIVLIEAMRSRLAVISTDCPHGPRELITDGVDGLLVPTGDVRALANAMERVVRDPVLRRRLARAGERTSRRYEPAEVARAWERVHRQATVAARARLG